MAGFLSTECKTILTESQLRAHTKCSEYNYLGGEYDYPPLIKTVKEIYERSLIHYMREDCYPDNKLFDKFCSQALTKYDSYTTVEESMKLHKTAPVIADEAMRTLLWHIYQPVWARDVIPIDISNSLFQLEISGILNFKAYQTLHMVTFTPYLNLHSVINDPINLLKLDIFKYINKPVYTKNARPRLVLHIFGANINELNPTLSYYSITDKQAKNTNPLQIKNLVRQIESDHHYPLIDCRHDCQFKKHCFPKGILDD